MYLTFSGTMLLFASLAISKMTDRRLLASLPAGVRAIVDRLFRRAERIFSWSCIAACIGYMALKDRIPNADGVRLLRGGFWMVALLTILMIIYRLRVVSARLPGSLPGPYFRGLLASWLLGAGGFALLWLSLNPQIQAA